MKPTLTLTTQYSNAVLNIYKRRGRYARADEEGKELNFDYWREDNGIGTRWLTAPVPTAEGQWALDVTDYDLDEQEEATTVPSYNPVPSEGE